jgi:enoyl-[acyl-carrier-protein] reductase (NADH)
MLPLMHNKRGLVMGVANQNSIAWGIARTLHAHGAEMAFTYQGEALGKRVKPLAESIGSKLVLPCDVEDIATVDAPLPRSTRPGAAIPSATRSTSSSMPSAFPTRTS